MLKRCLSIVIMGTLLLSCGPSDKENSVVTSGMGRDFVEKNTCSEVTVTITREEYSAMIRQIAQCEEHCSNDLGWRHEEFCTRFLKEINNP